MFTNDEIKEMLEAELSAMQRDKKIRRFTTTYNAFRGKFDIWFEWPDGCSCNLKDIGSVEDLKTEFKLCLPVKKSYKCSLCAHYIRECDGCRKGYFNSMFIPCPDFKETEIPPSDDALCKALALLKAECGSMVGPEAEIHKRADELICYILERKGYSKGVKKFNDIPYKGYEKPMSDECDEYLNYNDMIQWQCIMCRNALREGGCRDGLDEGWFMSNQCTEFKHLESAISPYDFELYLGMLIEEGNILKEDDCMYYSEILHWNADKLLCYVVESLGYTKFAKLYSELEKHYLDVPF